MALPTPEASPLEIAQSLERFLAEHPEAQLLEEGRVLFDLSHAKYSLSADHGRCVLHLWSDERNLVRTIAGLEERKRGLRLRVRRLGASQGRFLDVVPGGERRAPEGRALARAGYVRLLERVLAREFPDFRVQKLRSSLDLEHSFGPAYTRGVLARGNHHWAVIGVGAGESKATIDGVLTLGILWLQHCREHAGNTVCQGLRVFVPQGESATTRARMAWLDPRLGAWQLCELSESSENLTQIDLSDQGNLEMRLVHAFDQAAALERARTGIDEILRLVPEQMRNRLAIRARSPDEVAVSLYGLTFARVRQGFQPNSFLRRSQVIFGAGNNETPLEAATEPWLTDLVERLFAHRFPDGSARDPLFRLQPEAWLEDMLRRRLGNLEPALRSGFLYSQVPAFAAGDRGMLDLLTVTESGRLAVLELKAGEDLQLPLQGLDYWIRVHAVNQRKKDFQAQESELTRNGYFPGVELLADAPLLYFVLPALRSHPSMETVLRHFSPAVDWRWIALNETWRSAPKVIFRKRAGEASPKPDS